MPNATNDAAGWNVSYVVAGTGEKTITFKTENKFVDADARVTITAPAASNPSLDLADNNGNLTMGTPENGVYSPIATFTGVASVENAGWIAANDYNVSDTDIVVGKVNQSIITNGASTVPSGSTITPGPVEQTITISEGYNVARTITIGSAASSNAGEITSGSAVIDTLTYTYNNSTEEFDIVGSADVSAPTVDTAGYISGSVGTLNSNEGGAVISAALPKIAIQANLSGTGTKTPTITKNAATNITAAGNATTSEPSSGYYVAVSSAANTDTVQATATVTTAGYGTTTSGQYTTTPSSSLTVGAAASATTYIPIASTTFANAATSGITYSDISNTAPVLISGDFLYINEGYTPNVKISLAQLVPDATGTNASAAYILSGYTAFDNDGTLIIGTMQTYDGSYTIT